MSDFEGAIEALREAFSIFRTFASADVEMFKRVYEVCLKAAPLETLFEKAFSK
jgi:hypothetical protein